MQLKSQPTYNNKKPVARPGGILIQMIKSLFGSSWPFVSAFLKNKVTKLVLFI